jgi:hypothetical protein
LIEPGGTRTIDAFPGFLGGVSVTLGDVNGDGVADVIAGAGRGGGPHVKVFSGTDLSELASFFAFDPAFTGGVRVAAGDVNGDGRADLILGAGPGGGPHVRVLSGLDLSELASFWAYDPMFLNGVTVAAGDVNGDGRADIITGAGPGGGPHVRALSGLDLSELASFFAYDPGFTGGVNVAAGDLDGDGLSDIVTAAGPGGGPHVRVFSGLDLSDLASFFAFDPAFSGGVAVATGDIDGDGRVDLILGALDPHVRILSGVDLSELASFFTPPDMGAGISVGSIGDPPGIRFTSPATTTFTVGSAGAFTVTTQGGPVPAITLGGTLPTGVTFTDNGDRTATLAGTPGAGTGGSYALTFTADNGIGTPKTQTFTLTVNQAPALTSAAATTFTVGVVGSFGVTTSGFPAPAIVRSAAPLPAGVTWVDNGNGTGTLSGTPEPGTGGSYTFTFTADNGVSPAASQSFTLTVNGAPAFTSAAAATFTAGSLGSFAVTAVGTPTPTLTVSGTLPAGVTFVPSPGGTGTLSGTPAAGTGGTHAITFTASNGVLPDATQPFTLTINQAPAITSANTATFVIGTPGSFTVATSGFPLPTIARGGVGLPAGVQFTDNGNGTGTLSGTAQAGTGGSYAITFTAENVAGTSAAQNFVLTVNGPSAFTSAPTTTFTVGVPGSFTVTAGGTPAPAITLTGGTLPAGVTFTSATGILSGTPAAGTGGIHALTFTASNGVGPDSTQQFTLIVNEAPSITSAASATFLAGTPGSFTVTTLGFPAPALTMNGTPPSGVTFVDNGNGTGTLTGTPDATSGGIYILAFAAQNSVSASPPQTFVLTVNQAPVVTSANSTAFSVGQAGSFTVTATGFPAPSITHTGGTLPTGVTFAAGVLSGTPASGSAGPHALVFTIANVAGSVTQSFTLNVLEGPVITSASSVTFTLGAPNTFTVTASGFLPPTLTQGGTLPAGVTWQDNGNGTGTLSGTPQAGTGGNHPLTFTAANASGTAVQNFTLNVTLPPAITSANTTTFTVGAAGTFTVTATGFPAPTFSVTGTLPTGVTFAGGVLSGTPAAGTGGSYPLAFTASNGVLPNATQPFTLIVNQAPAITSAANVTFTVGAAGSFTVTTSGFPAPTIARGGVALPNGVTFVDNGNGTGTLAGMPAAGTGGTYAISFTATNVAGSSPAQAFTLTVNQAPAVTSANTVNFRVSVAGSFTVTTSGFPVPTIARGGVALPNGVTFVDNGNGTGTLAGTPAAGTGGAYAITFTATNSVGSSPAQAFTLNVEAPPAITSANSDTFTVGTADSFTVTTTGFPAPTVSQTGTLPAGVTFNTGTKVLGGTATQTGTFNLVFTATNAVPPDATQNFTLNVICPTITVNPSTAMPEGLYQIAYGGATFTQSGSTGSTITWTAIGLPAGLTINSATGVVSGTPTNTVANAVVTVTATDNFGCSGSRGTTITVRPVATADSYTGGVGNTQFVVGAAVTTPAVAKAGTVRDNDNGPGTLTVAFNSPSANAGTIAEGPTDGTFIYTPALAFGGPTDTFTYTLTDGNGVTNTGTVTIALSGMVWYVNNAGGAGDGRSNNPFNTLNAAATPSAAGSHIYVHTGTGTTTGALTMDANQTLHGAGGTFTLNDLIIGAAGKPTLGGTVTVANSSLIQFVNFVTGTTAITGNGTSGLTLNDVDISGSAGAGTGIALTGVSGTIDLNDVDFNSTAAGSVGLSLTNVTGATDVDSNSSFASGNSAEVLISGGTGNVTIAAPISSTAGRAVDIQNRTSGAVTFTGAITDAGGTGILLNANGTSTFSFSGGLTLNGAGTTFTATNPSLTGTLTLTGTNTIGATTPPTSGTALNVTNVTIGASGLTFRSISANGVTNGIVLNNTGATAGLIVTGNAGTCTNANTTGCSGGEIRNTTGADTAGATPPGTGIVLNNTIAPSLTRMWIHDNSNFAIRGTSVQGFTMANTVINGVNGTNDGFDEGAVSFTNLTGSASVTTSFIGGAIEHNMQVLNSSGTLNRLTVTGTTFGGMDTTFGSDGLLVESAGTAVMNVTVDGNTFTSARGDHFQYSNTTAAQAGDVVFTNNTITNNHPAVVSGGGGIRVVGGNNTGQNGSITFNVSNNTMRGARGTALAVNKLGGTGTYSGTIANNAVGATGVQGSGSLEGSGIFVLSDGGGTYTASITGNTVRQYDNDGIFMQTGGSGVIGSGTMNVTVTGNTVTEPETQAPGALATNGFHLNGGTTVGDTYQICLNLSGNTLAGSGQDTIPPGSTFGDFRLRQRQSTTVRLPGYAGGATDVAAVVTFLQGQNPGGESGVASANSPPGGGFVGGAACPTP